MNRPPPASKFAHPHADEVFFALEAPSGRGFDSALAALMGRYGELMAQERLDLHTEVFLRFHVSDLAQQAERLESRLPALIDRGLVSVVEQPPASGSEVAVEAYHVRAPGQRITRARLSPDTLAVSHGRYTSLWHRGRPESLGSADQQTRQLFRRLSAELAPLGGRLKDHVVRTWLYLRQIEQDYQGMVKARRELFEEQGLSRDTHFIASTGIEGAGERATDKVIMDALAITGLEPDQLTFMCAPEFLCPTTEYGVTFERATRVIYGDRSHFYISGTASIDHQGQILHRGDVARQTARALVNIQALLDGYGASLAELKQLVVYLRDPAHEPQVSEVLAEALPRSTPRILVRGAVCRPEWLVEIEGVAVSPRADLRFASFYDPKVA